MLRDRVIFALIYSSGSYNQSRNFRLQRVGGINWLETNYKFQKISFSLDELIVLNATRGVKNTKEFGNAVSELVRNVFIPIAAGGGITNMHDVELLFNSGADKVVLNTSLYDNAYLVRKIVQRYGSQSVVASIDYKILDGEAHIYINDGSEKINKSMRNYLKYVEELGVGEILLNSIDKDGTGFGYDLATVKKYANAIDIPLIIMGGAGNENHLSEGLNINGVSAVATANLFNFIGDGLPLARKFMLTQGANLAKWE
jgi:imidazole glycerol-phosphate synthase subunit HisF